jgi:hypothetical protein
MKSQNIALRGRFFGDPASIAFHGRFLGHMGFLVREISMIYVFTDLTKQYVFTDKTEDY